MRKRYSVSFRSVISTPPHKPNSKISRNARLRNLYEGLGAGLISANDTGKAPPAGATLCSAFAVADIHPAGAVALPARFFVSGPRSQAGRACLPIGFVCGTANDTGAALAGCDLRTLAADQLSGVGNGPATGTDGHRL